MEVIESILDIEIIEILKSAVAIITVTAVFFNFKDKFSNFQSKSQLNTDFGILEKAKKIPNINTELIQNHIESEIEKLYPDDPPKKLFNLFYGGTLFIGFGWWTIDIIQNSDSFNGWCILTMLTSLIGITIIFDNKNKEKTKDEFYRISFHDKSNFRTGCFLIIGLIIALLIMTYYRKYNVWYYVIATLLGIFSLSSFSNVKFTSSKLKQDESR